MSNQNYTPKDWEKLSTYEEEVLMPAVIDLVNLHKGKRNAISGRSIVDELRRHQHEVNTFSLKKIIRFIRLHKLGQCLIVNNKGYFIAENRQEIIEYLSFLDKRIKTLLDEKTDAIQSYQQL